MLISYKLGQDSIILRVKLTDSSKLDNTGPVNLLFNTVGLNISTIADNEATVTTYSSLTNTIEDIATLGTYVAPTATKCRLRQVDPNNHSGVYEIQIADARFNVSSSKSILITIAAITALNVSQSDSLIPLVRHDPYLPQPTNFNQLLINSGGGVILQDVGLDQIIEDTYTIPQLIAVIAAMVAGTSSGLPASPATFNSLDGSNVRAVIAFDSSSNRPSSIITPP